MSASQSTLNYNLPLFEPTDVPTWQGDWNSTMTKLDSLINEAMQGGVKIEQSTGTSTDSVMSQKAVSDEINLINEKAGAVAGQVNNNTTSITEIKTTLANKQNTLVSGENIKTINGESLLGSGNIDIESGGTAPVMNATLLSFTSSSANFPLSSGQKYGSLIRIGRLVFLNVSLVCLPENVSGGSYQSFSFTTTLPETLGGSTVYSQGLPCAVRPLGDLAFGEKPYVGHGTADVDVSGTTLTISGQFGVNTASNYQMRINGMVLLAGRTL